MARRTSIVAAVVGAALVALASPAAARDGEIVAKEKAAKKACAMGDYQKGSDILTDLFVATNDVAYIYNQARCYEQNNLWERAIARFKEFLRKARDLSPAERAETEQHIAECQEALSHMTPQVSEPPPPTLIPTVSESTSQPPTTPTESAASAAQPSPASTNGRGRRIAGIVTGAVGIAAIGAGVGFALKTQSISSNEEKNGPTKEQEDERRKYETFGWVAYGVGAAAIATGVVLYVLGWSADDSHRVSLLPSVSPTCASLMLTGRL